VVHAGSCLTAARKARSSAQESDRVRPSFFRSN
jgi:hypothetical protein